MRTQTFAINTTKEAPAETEIVSHQLMLKAGLTRQLAGGLYTWMPMGLKSLKKAQNIIRNEMTKAGALELLMPMVQPADLWTESGRINEYGAELLQFTDRHDRQFCLGPTHEEIITDIARNMLQSYRQLPINFFQIQTKFRDEIRPRYGVMRAREFLMKDAYSFHASEDCLGKTYDIMFETYHNIFHALGLEFRAVQADNGSIGGSSSHEFHVLAEAGEDSIAFSDQSNFAANVELIDVKAGDPSPCGAGNIEIKKGIEVGHIFKLGTKYSERMKATVLDANGKAQPLAMGCYGIGVSRIIAASIEQNHDERGIIWPKALAPFDVAIVPLNMQKSPEVKAAAEKLYQQLLDLGIDVLLDDRDERPGIKFADMELIGLPYQIIVGSKGLQQNQVEIKIRTPETKGQTKANQDISIDAVIEFISNTL